MTKKDYFLIAKAIKTAFPTGDTKFCKRRLLKELIPALKADNPAFQSLRFILSCDALDLEDQLK